MSNEPDFQKELVEKQLLEIGLTLRDLDKKVGGPRNWTFHGFLEIAGLAIEMAAKELTKR